MVEEVLKIVSSAGHAAEQARRGDAVVQALRGAVKNGWRRPGDHSDRNPDQAAGPDAIIKAAKCAAPPPARNMQRLVRMGCGSP